MWVVPVSEVSEVILINYFRHFIEPGTNLYVCKIRFSPHVEKGRERYYWDYDAVVLATQVVFEILKF